MIAGADDQKKKNIDDRNQCEDDDKNLIPDGCSEQQGNTVYENDEIRQQEWKARLLQMSTRSSVTSTSSNQSFKNGDILTVTTSSYEEYKYFLRNYDTTQSLYIFYAGSISANSGYSWCRACCKALPLIEQALKGVHNSIFFTVYVGTQQEWEDRLNPYRLHQPLKLRTLPTLHKYGTSKRLESGYCLKSKLLELLIEDDVGAY